MQTNFTEQQLADPRVAEANAILRSCVHCGFCTATCPTYVLLGDELDSPRGRIYQIKDMLENDKPASKEVTTHIDRCLSCLSCMTTCPSGVDYMHLVDIARAHVYKTYRRPIKSRLLRSLLAFTLPDPGRFRLSLYGAALARPVAGLFDRIGLHEVSAMLALAPRGRLPKGRFQAPSVVPARGRRKKKRVSMLMGCAQQVLRPQINDATVRLLTRLGVEVVLSDDVGCCGALVHHMGREEDGHAAAKRNVDAWSAAMRDGGLDAVIINASGCGTTVKDYGHMLKIDKGYAERAGKISSLAVDITEFLAEHGLGAVEAWSDLNVAYHSACSMQHGQRIHSPPRKLLHEAGFSVAEIPEAHLCCGSAGTYNIFQSEIAVQLRDRKVNNIMLKRPDLVATGNIGCLTQLQDACPVPVVHTVELLDWATGGPCPSGLAHLKHRVKTVRGLVTEPAE